MEIPYDFPQRFDEFATHMNMKRSEAGEDEIEVQVHLGGYRKTEGEDAVVVITEMIIPDQKGDL